MCRLVIQQFLSEYFLLVCDPFSLNRERENLQLIQATREKLCVSNLDQSGCHKMTKFIISFSVHIAHKHTWDFR